MDKDSQVTEAADVCLFTCGLEAEATGSPAHSRSEPAKPVASVREEDSSAVCGPQRLPVPASITLLPRNLALLFPRPPSALCTGQSCSKDKMSSG